MTSEQKAQIRAYIRSCASRRFRRGEWDCAIFCADILQILKGEDFAAPYRGKYSDREGAISVLPCPLADLPMLLGLKPSHPRDGAVWWCPTAHPEGALGIFWQGRCLQPGKRGISAPISNTKQVKFYY